MYSCDTCSSYKNNQTCIVAVGFEFELMLVYSFLFVKIGSRTGRDRKSGHEDDEPDSK